MVKHDSAIIDTCLAPLQVRQAYAVLRTNLGMFMQLETQRKQLAAAGRG